MNRTVTELSPAGNVLATQTRVAGLVRAVLAAPLACSPARTMSLAAASPGLVEFEHQEVARRAKEAERMFQQERQAVRFTKD
jgi:hypothetical protein